MRAAITQPKLRDAVASIPHLDWIALTESERKSRGSAGLVAKHSMLLAVGARAVAACCGACLELGDVRGERPCPGAVARRRIVLVSLVHRWLLPGGRAARASCRRRYAPNLRADRG